MAQKRSPKETGAKSSRAKKPDHLVAKPETATLGPRLSFHDDYLSPQQLRQILEERARALARPPDTPEEGTRVQIVTFRLGQEYYAVEAGYAEHIFRLREWTPVPGTPEFCVGVVNLRGRIVSVVDLHAFFGLDHVPVQDDAQVIVVKVDGLEVGLVVNEVRSVGPLLLEKLAPVLPTTSQVAAEYTRGVTPEMVVLLDLPALMRDRRIIVHQEP